MVRSTPPEVAMASRRLAPMKRVDRLSRSRSDELRASLRVGEKTGSLSEKAISACFSHRGSASRTSSISGTPVLCCERHQQRAAVPEMLAKRSSGGCRRHRTQDLLSTGNSDRKHSQPASQRAQTPGPPVDKTVGSAPENTYAATPMQFVR